MPARGWSLLPEHEQENFRWTCKWRLGDLSKSDEAWECVALNDGSAYKPFFLLVSVAPGALADPMCFLVFNGVAWLGPIAVTLLDGHWDAQLGGLSLASVSMYHWFV